MRIFLAFTAIAFFIVVSIVYRSIKNGISPMPTSLKAGKAVTSLLPNIQGNIYELGSGWGTLALLLAKHYPKCTIIGLETSPIPFYLSKMLLFLSNRSNVTFKRQDFFHIPLNDAQLVVCYLYPGAMTHLKEKFEKELQPGTYIISNTFAVPGWTPLKVVEVPDLYHSKVYLYRIL